MASELTPQSIRNLGVYGVIRNAEVDDSLIPDGAVTEVVNFHFDRKGVSTLRPGLTTLGATVLTARPCVGLFNAQSGTMLAVFSNGTSAAIYSYNGSSWGVSLTDGTASINVRFVDFGSYTIAVNFMYNTYSSMRFWNAGSTRHWHFTGNPINPQQMWGYNPQFGEVYKSKIYLAGDNFNPSRLFSSSVISITGNVTWNPIVDYVDINPGDGENITGLKRYSSELEVFKPNYIYRFRTSGVDPDPLIKIGTRSNESIVEGKKGLYFFHDTGCYRYSGGYPEELSRPISDVINAIPFSQLSSIVGWNDSDHIYWSVGKLTISDVNTSSTWANVVLRYTESSDLWTIYSYSNDIRRGSIYNNGTSLTRVVGTDHGVVATHNLGTTDFGEPIKARIITKYYEIDNVVNQKVLQRLVALCEKAQGVILMYQVDDSPEWNTINDGQLRTYTTLFDDIHAVFHRIRFKITVISSVEAVVFKGLEIIKGLNEGIV